MTDLDIEKIRINRAFSLSIVGLALAAVLVIALLIAGWKVSSDIVAVVGLFTSILGTLIGSFFGFQIGASDKDKAENRAKEAANRAQEAETRANEAEKKATGAGILASAGKDLADQINTMAERHKGRVKMPGGQAHTEAQSDLDKLSGRAESFRSMIGQLGS